MPDAPRSLLLRSVTPEDEPDDGDGTVVVLFLLLCLAVVIGIVAVRLLWLAIRG